MFFIELIYLESFVIYFKQLSLLAIFNQLLLFCYIGAFDVL